jgi:hypothetical protein
MLKWPNSMIADGSDRRTIIAIVNHVAAGNHRLSQASTAARMNVQVIQFGERKREPEMAPSYSISDNSTGLGSYGLYHIETNTLEISQST